MKMLLTLVMVMTFAACRQTPLPPPTGRVDTVSVEDYPQIVPMEGLGSYVVFAQPLVRSGPDLPMTVQVPLRLESRHEVNAQYRFIFFDASGAQLRPEMEWRYIRLPSRAQRIVEGASVDTNAVDWRFEVRPAR